MSNITQDFLDEFIQIKEKYEDMLFKIMEQIEENDKLEGKYINEVHPIYNGDVCRIEINKYFDVTTHYWDYRNEEYTEGGYIYPLDKLLSDDWKENAIAKYKKELEKKQKEKELIEAKLAKEQEEKERAEYECLKAKYE